MFFFVFFSQNYLWAIDLIMDELIDKVVKSVKLEKKILTEFQKAKTNAQKVDIVENVLKNLGIEIPSIIATKKDDQKAIQFSRSGDKWLARKTNNFDALVNYNESICFAENLPRSEILSHNYAQRARIYFEWKLWKICLKNIEFARNAAGCSDQLLETLLKLENECTQHIKLDGSLDTDVKKMYTPLLSFTAHSKIPFIAECLDIRENKQYGRYIITHKQLQPGQIIAIEEKYFNVLIPKMRYQRCANCLEENALSLFPCKYCTGAMFCTPKCFNSAQNSFHQYECPIIDYLHENFDRFHLCAVRATIMAFLSYKTVDKLIEGVQLADRSEPVTAFTINHKKKSVQQKYLQIHTFPTKQEQRHWYDLIGTAIPTVLLYKQLLAHTKFADILTCNISSIIKELIFKHLQISRMYFHSLSSADRQYRIGGGGLRGSGAYPFCSLINHACTPNILRIPFGTKMIVFVLRPIKIGEQLFDNYG